jgi:lysophospholipase L1-like esterase
VAFGDSITEGVLTGCMTTSEPHQQRTWPPTTLELMSLRAAVNLPTSYPSVLQGLLLSRYTTQSIVVANAGQAGECAAGCRPPFSNGIDRLPGVLAQQSPQVLLLQEGINNINSNNPASIPVAVEGLRTMIRQARGRAAIVLLGTLLPERAGACRGYAPGLVAPANDQIRAMAAAEGAFVVDLYAAFGGVAGDLIGTDGLHPNEAGYRKIAETFFEEIKNRLEAR